MAALFRGPAHATAHANPVPDGLARGRQARRRRRRFHPRGGVRWGQRSRTPGNCLTHGITTSNLQSTKWTPPCSGSECRGWWRVQAPTGSLGVREGSPLQGLLASLPGGRPKRVSRRSCWRRNDGLPVPWYPLGAKGVEGRGNLLIQPCMQESCDESSGSVGRRGRVLTPAGGRQECLKGVPGGGRRWTIG